MTFEMILDDINKHHTNITFEDDFDESVFSLIDDFERLMAIEITDTVSTLSENIDQQLVIQENQSNQRANILVSISIINHNILLYSRLYVLIYIILHLENIQGTSATSSDQESRR